MTIQNLLFKEHQEIVPNLLNRPPLDVPRWRPTPESHPPLAASYGGDYVQSKLTSLELSAGWNNTQFTFPSAETAENGFKTNVQTVTPVEAATSEYQGRFSLRYGQPSIAAAHQCYGVYSTCGPQVSGRIMLPLCVASGGRQIFVNAKQYNRILMRRQLRAKAKMKNPAPKSRKPYMHLSRHLHAIRRSRGSGGRFLNTKNSNISSQKNSYGTTNEQEKSVPQPTESQVSEVLQSDEVTNSNRYTSRGSEVTSHLFTSATPAYPFQFNHFHHLFQPFQNVANSDSGIGISMVAENHLGI